MIITGKYKIGFVHIPKTSGTSLKSWFRAVANDAEIFEVGYHSTLPEMQLPTDYTSVAVIRNPWDRMVSFYEFRQYLKQEKQNGAAVLMGEPEENLEFNEWMLHVHKLFYTTPNHKTFVNQRQPFWFTPLTPQVIWLPQDPDILIRFENLGEGYGKLHEIMQTNLKIPHVYRSPKKGAYQEYYNDHSRELVAKYFALDIERWGYTF